MGFTFACICGDYACVQNYFRVCVYIFVFCSGRFVVLLKNFRTVFAVVVVAGNFVDVRVFASFI